LPANKEKKLAELMKRLSPEAVAPLKDYLRDGVVSKLEFKRLLGLMTDAFDELLNDTPNTKRMEKKLRELIVGLGDLKYEGEIGDETLRTAVKLIRERIVGQSQRESLARLLTDEFVRDWTKADPELIEKIADYDGLLEMLADKADAGPDFADTELSELLVELGGHVAARYAARLSDADLDSLLDRAIVVAQGIESRKNIGDPLLELARDGMQKLGIIALMRRAFTGLLIGDLILRQVGKSLNIKGNTTVTDFIIFVGVKVFESENIGKTDRAQVTRTRKDLEAVRAM